MVKSVHIGVSTIFISADRLISAWFYRNKRELGVL